MQFFRPGCRCADAVRILIQAHFQFPAAVREYKGAVREHLQIIRDRLTAVGQLIRPVFQFTRTVRRLLHSVAHRGKLVKQDFRIGLRHLFPHRAFQFLHGGLTHLGRDIVRPRIRFTGQRHFLRIRVRQRCGMGREVLRDGDDHIVGSVLKSLLRLRLRWKPEVQSIIVFQFIHQIFSNVQLLIRIGDRHVMVDDRHRQLVDIPVRIPHGSEEKRGIDRRDRDDRDRDDQKDFIFEQFTPFLFQHLSDLPSVSQHLFY